MGASVQQLEASAVLAQLCLLAVAISIGHWLKRRGVLWIGSAGVALLLGVVVGLIVRLAGTAPVVSSWLMFQSDFFFLVLLPPIMFDASFSLDVRLLVKNWDSVCILAFYGTTASTFALGFNMWAAGKAGLCYQLSILQAFTFGALISATDPVTVLAVFQQLGAQPDLYMNVFGESVLNDAVAMVLFQTLQRFAEHEVAVSAASIIGGIASFISIFLGSMLLGIVLGLGAAALLRPRWYYGETNHETGLVLLCGYASYMAGTAAGLSGIVCVMFCAMVMGNYAAPNLSPGGLQASRSVYAVLASTMEVFVFVYIGLSLFMEPQEWHMLRFMVVCMFGLAWSRAVNVVPSCAAVNYWRPHDMAIPPKQQMLLWWAGLRGAMAFALSVEAAKTFGEPGKVMMTATFMAILCTVLINGGSTGYLLAFWGLTDGAQQQKQQHHELEEQKPQQHVALLLGQQGSRDFSSAGSLAEAESASEHTRLLQHAEHLQPQGHGSAGAAAANGVSGSPVHCLRLTSVSADGAATGDSFAQVSVSVSSQQPATCSGGDRPTIVAAPNGSHSSMASLEAAASAANLVTAGSEMRQLEAVREVSGHGLQRRLDGWHASLFTWFINPESSAEHTRWQALQQQQQQQGFGQH